MNILTRISRLFKADIHGILDSLEQPEIILQQSVRDMQSEIDKAELTISELDKQQDKLEQKHQCLEANIKELQEQLQFCFSENNEALGKSVVRKKLQAEVSLKELSRQLANRTEEKKLKISETDERKEKLQAIRDKLALFTEKTGLNESYLASKLNSNSIITQDDIELAFLYEKKCYVDGSADHGEKL